jgi:hypothetical protein
MTIASNLFVFDEFITLIVDRAFDKREWLEKVV